MNTKKQISRWCLPLLAAVAMVLSAADSTKGGLVGYWGFETIASGTTPDLSGNGNSLEVLGDAALDSDTPALLPASNNSMLFDGDGDWLRRNLPLPTLRVVGSVTMSVWLKRPQVTTAGPSQQIISRGADNYRWRLNNVNATTGEFDHRVWAAGGNVDRLISKWR